MSEVYESVAANRNGFSTSQQNRKKIAKHECRSYDCPVWLTRARRAWSDSRGRIWVSEWNAGKLARFEPARKRWREWRVPGANPMPYAVYVDERDKVWLSDFGANALVRFDPLTSRFTRVRLPSANAAVRQILGRRDEVWGAESGTDRLVVVRG